MGIAYSEMGRVDRRKSYFLGDGERSEARQKPASRNGAAPRVKLDAPHNRAGIA
jgi:hypothetical protein